MTIEIKPLTMHTGAEISGVDITQPLSQSDAGEIWDAFLKWKVIAFRDQKMDHAQQVSFARTFGELTIGHAVFGHVEGYPEIYSVAKTVGITATSQHHRISDLGQDTTLI